MEHIISQFTFTYSFVLLTFNQAATVREAVLGALAQNCIPLEIIISDDCSSDLTFDLIQETVDSYEGPHRVILNKNERNLGLAGHIDRIHDLSHGDVIIVAAGDDISLPQRCARIIETFETKQPLLVCSLANEIDLSGQSISTKYRTATLYNSLDLSDVAGSRSLYLGATGAWQRSLYQKYGAIDSGAYEDLVMGFRAALEGKIAVIDEALVIYRVGGGLSSSDLISFDVNGLYAAQIRQLSAWKAVLRQRIKDAQTFGLAPSSSIWAILKNAKTRTNLNWAYYHNDTGSFLKQAFRNPILAFRTVRTERRRKRKVVNKLRTLVKNSIRPK